ncbi:MAG: GAF domain-containing sensor histidine kinase [Anaerolineae bacterium]
MTTSAERAIDLVGVLRSHREEIANAWADMAPGMPGDHPPEPPPAENVAVIKQAVDAIAEALSTGSYAALETYLNDLRVARVSAGYDVSVVIESLLLIKKAVIPFIAEGHAPTSPAVYEAIAQVDDCLQYMIAGFGRLFAEMQRRLQAQQERTALLLRTLQIANSSLELDVVLGRVAEAITEAVAAPYCAIYLVDAERGVLVTKASAGESGDIQHASWRQRLSDLVSFPLLLEVLERKKPIISANPPGDPRLDQAIVEDLGLTSLLVAPIRVGSRVLGVAVLGTSEENQTFTSEEIGLTSGIVSAVALAIENVRLYEETSRRLDESQSLQRVTAALLQKLDLNAVLEIVCSAAQRLTGAPGSILFLLEDNDWLYPAHMTGLPPSPLEPIPVDRSFSGRAVRKGKTLLTNDIAGQIWPLPTDIPVTAILAAPLLVRGSAIGVLDVMNKPAGFSVEDARIISLFADQAAIAIENARLRQQEEHVAVLEERQRLSRELHDSVTQALYGVTLFADAATRLLEAGDSGRALEHLRQVRITSQEALREMRLLIFELRPLDLQEQGLVAALKARLAAVESRVGLAVELQVDGERRLPVEIEDVLYRVAHEALNNVLKHAHAQHATVRLQLGEARVRLEVADDGIGFDPIAAQAAGGLGLGGMSERVEHCGGTLEVESAPGQGTRVRVEVPIP